MTTFCRQAAEVWASYTTQEIPSKGVKLPELFQEVLNQLAKEIRSPAVALETRSPTSQPLRIFEVGCGVGELAANLSSQGHLVVGCDVNPGAVDVASMRSSGATFFCGNVASADFIQVASAALGQREVQDQFDFVVLQLFLSVVGGRQERKASLQAALSLLRPGGALYASCSGVSGDINPAYAALYAQDRTATGEENTYYSRNEAGEVLYVTHHFEPVELEALLAECGFVAIQVVVKKEASSRRPSEVANFLYATARKA